MTERIARKPMKKILACAIFITIWILFQQSPIHSVEAYSSLSFTEDFTTDLYRHPIYSNVTGWEEETGTISISNTIEIVGSRDTPDWALGVHVVADLAYVADDESGLQIINVSDPVAPFIVGAKNTYGWAWDVFVDNKYAYVADNHYTSNGALLIMNVTNPSVTPTVISYVNITGVLGVYVEGDYAYLAQSSGIRVVDVSDPTNPSLVGSCNIPLSPAREIVVEGDYAYAAGDFQDIQVINITNPKDPGVNGSTGGVIGYSAEAVAIDGDFAYLGAGNYVYAIDISDPTDPKVAEESPSLGGSVMGIAIDGDYLYCVCDGKGVGFNGLKVLDISDPTDTSEIASIETLGKANDVFIDGNYAYVAASNYGLQIIKISDTIDPSSVGVLSSPEYAQGVTVKGNYAFLADGSAGLKVIDISDPTNPTSKGTQDTVYAQAVAVAGDYAYIADGGGGLEIIDISDPTAPSSEATYSTIDYATDVEIVGNYAFVADREGGLQIVNITHPSLPTNISAIKVGVDSFTWGVFIRGNYAYLATSVDGSGAGAPPPYHIGSLNVVNITDITNPQYVNHTTQELVGYPVVDQVFDVWVEGNYAYLAWGGRGLRVIDITDPLSSLTEVSYINTSIARARDLFVSRNWLFLVDETGLQVTNISDPFNPEITYNYTTVGSAYDVFVKGEHAFIADQDQGLRVLKVKQSKTSQYKPFAIAQSRAFFISSYPSHVANATLTAIDNTPEGTFIEYYLSRVNGTEFFEPFYQVTSGIEFTFPENPQIAGFDNWFVWKATLSTTNSTATPSISSITVTFSYFLDNPILTSPGEGFITSDTTPTFEWDLQNDFFSEASKFELQLDTSKTFDSSDFISIIKDGTSHTLVSPLSDGIWYWRVRANDSDGHWGSFSPYRNISIDTIGPSITLPNHVNDSLYRPNEIIDIIVTDLNFDTALYHWDDETENQTGDSTFQTNLPISIEQHYLHVYANDTLGFWSYTYFVFTAEDVAPEISLSGIANNSIHQSEKVIDVVVNDNSLDNVLYHWDDASVNQSGSASFQTSLPTGDAEHILHVFANDTAGNENYKRFLFLTDDTTPTIILNTPENNTVQTSAVTLDFTILDTNLHSVLYNWDGISNSSLSDPYNLSNIPSVDSTHFLNVYANDSAGNWQYICYLFIIDNTPPEISLNTPSNGSVVLTDTWVEFSINDPNGVESTIYYNWDDNPNTTLNTVISSSIQIDFNTGQHHLHIYAEDSVGNWAKATFSFTVDGTNPVITLVNPTDNFILQSGYIVSFTVTDNLSLNQTLYNWDGNNNLTISSPYTTTLPADEGSHTLSVFAQDIAGNWKSVSFTFTTDDTPPSVESITGLINETDVSGTINIIAVVDDANGISMVEFLIDGNPTESDELAPYSWVWDTTTVDNGEYTVSVRVTDVAGNEYVEHYSIRVANTAGGGSGGGLDIAQLGIIVVSIAGVALLATAAVIGYGYLKKRGG